MLKRLVLLSAALIGLAAVGLSQQGSPGVSGSDAVAARQARLDMSSITLRSMGQAIKAGEEPKSSAYAASALAKWAKALPRMLPAGTGKGETSAFSQALPAIWQDRAGFEQAAADADYADATRQLAGMAQANDTAGLKKQLEEVNQACAACHARYKYGDQTGPKK
jgi:cytochrome c556